MFYRDRQRVRSLHAASFYAEAGAKEAQRKIGRANRLLIWESMMRYQADGVQIFDLGGWYTGTTNTGLLGVNKFKEGFGGKVVCEYEGEQLKTLKAWCGCCCAAFEETEELEDASNRSSNRPE